MRHPLRIALLTAGWIASAPSIHAADEASRLAPLVSLLGRVDDAAIQKDVLAGMLQALQGNRSVTPPASWSAVSAKLLQSADAEVRERATQLAVLFGDPNAIATLTAKLKDAKAEASARAEALQTLLPRRDPALVPHLYALLDDASMRGPAIRALAAYENADLPETLVAAYPKCTDAEKQDVVATLVMRHKSADALITAMEQKRIPARDVSMVSVRQIEALKSPEFNQRLAKVWGTIRSTSGEKAAILGQYRSQLSEEVVKKADRSRGRLVYSKICANCHKLFDDGRPVGPELTGSQRRNIEYILENLIDPSAVVGRDYQLTTIVTKDGRVLNGVVKQENDNAVVLLTERDTVTVPKEDIDERKQQAISMMPEGVLQKLSTEEVRDLMGYLSGESQAPLPK